MNTQELISKAYAFALYAHQGQTRKFGKDKGLPYIVHPTRVADKVDGMAKVVAFLHDTIEDTSVKYEDLVKEFGHEVADSVLLLTRDKETSYYDFIQNLIDYNERFGKDHVLSRWAIEVKIAGIEDNLSDLKEGSLKDKYRFVLDKLKLTL